VRYEYRTSRCKLGWWLVQGTNSWIIKDAEIVDRKHKDYDDMNDWNSHRRASIAGIACETEISVAAWNLYEKACFRQHAMASQHIALDLGHKRRKYHRLKNVRDILNDQRHEPHRDYWVALELVEQ
jgi:hypothetical protein